MRGKCGGGKGGKYATESIWIHDQFKFSVPGTSWIFSLDLSGGIYCVGGTSQGEMALKGQETGGW